MGKETITIINTIDVDTLKNAVDGIAKAVDSLPSALGLERLESIVKVVDSLRIIVNNNGSWLHFWLPIILQFLVIVVMFITIVATNRVSRDIQRQDVNLKLFDRRIETRYRLLDWHKLIKGITFTKVSSDIMFMFRTGLFVNMGNPALQDYSAQIDDCERLIVTVEKEEQKNVFKTRQKWLFYKKWCHILRDVQLHMDIAENYFGFNKSIADKLKTFRENFIKVVEKCANFELEEKGLSMNEMIMSLKELSKANEELFDGKTFIEAINSQIDELKESLSLNVTPNGDVVIT